MAGTNLETLSELFNEKIFRIPDYQRGYAWALRQLDDFWQDLSNLREGHIHYTGMITVENKGEYYHVIDGQQRLTTLMILLKVILDRFDDDDWIGEYEKRDYVKKFLFKRIGKEGKSVKVIFGYEKDNPSDIYYRTKILDLSDSESYSVPQETLYTKNLAFAKKYFVEKIDEHYKKNGSIDKYGLEKLFMKIVKKLKFNYYELDDELDEFVTFETMNNRGKPLTTLELLKNRLIYLSTLLRNDDVEIAKLRNDINNAWKTIYEYLGKNPKKPIDDDKFLKDHWIMYFAYDRSVANVERDFLLNKHFTPKKVLFRYSDRFDEIVKTIKEHRKSDWEKIVKNSYVDYDDIEKYVLNIQKAVREYYFIENPDDSPYGESMKRWLSKLNRVGFGAFKPLIIALMTHKERKERIVEILKYAENYVFLVFQISNRRSNTGDSRFFKLANEYHTTKDYRDILQKIENEIYSDEKTYKWVDVDRFVENVQDLYKTADGYYSWKGLKYFLYEYELYLQEKVRGERKLHWEEINKESIEHIYPQTADKECWQDTFGSLMKKERQILLHSLGNLLLLATRKNSKLKNECFEVKKEAFSNGSYAEIEVSKERIWEPKSIKNRSRTLLEFLSERWDIEITEEQYEKLVEVL